MAFEQAAQKRLGKKAANLTFVILPTNRAGLLPMLTSGRADLAAGIITVTEGRRARVDFSDPFHTEVREVLVTGPAAPEVKTAEDMLASKVYLRPSTSFYEHLTALNAKRVAAGKAPFPVEPADENLTDDDLIEMVGNGIIPATIADEPVARLFAQVFENVRVRDDLVLASDQPIAWAMRKDSPKLQALVNAYVAKARKRAAKLGLDPNVWLDNVEIAEAKVVSREPVVYVRNSDKYHVAYKLLTEGKVTAAAGG
jgi:membrane-bound lytic murein transglycosylase MltF